MRLFAFVRSKHSSNLHWKDNGCVEIDTLLTPRENESVLHHDLHLHFKWDFVICVHHNCFVLGQHKELIHYTATRHRQHGWLSCCFSQSICTERYDVIYFYLTVAHNSANNIAAVSDLPQRYEYSIVRMMIYVFILLIFFFVFSKAICRCNA